MISASMVRELRERTGAAMMDCKKALEEAKGDMEAAVDVLRKQGLKAAAKKASREMPEGRVAALVAADGKSGAIVGLSCETDFVARTADFQAFLAAATEAGLAHVRGERAEALEQLSAARLPGADETVASGLTQLVGKLGENIRLAAAARYGAERGVVSAYVHHTAKIGALVSVATDAPLAKASDAAKKLAQHICAAKPLCLERSQVPAELVDRERAVHMESEELAARPPEMREKIVAGKIEKFYQASALAEQPWTFEEKLSVQKALEKELGPGTRVEHFCLVEL